MLLNKAELLEKYYTRGNPIDDADVVLYLSRANTWCIGYIGGVPPLLPGEPQDRPGLKIAVATCFEIMARGETKQINPDTGNITEVAPPTGAVKTSTQYKAFDQFVIVREMLLAYKIAFEDQTSKTDRGVKFFMIIKIELDGGLDKFISGANSAAAAVDSMEERIVRQAGIAGLENVAANIHSRSGRLAQSYTVGGNENIFDVQAGGGSASVRYGSNCPYAVPAEEGYNQSNRVSKSTGRKPSLWVPGSGSGSNLVISGAKTGMKLSGRFVPGQHMFEKSLPDTKEDLRKITKSEVERLFRALF